MGDFTCRGHFVSLEDGLEEGYVAIRVVSADSPCPICKARELRYRAEGA